MTPTNLDLVWAFCSEHNLRLDDGLPAIPPPRENDVYLMQAFANMGFSPKERCRLNHCRLYLQTIFLSDLCTGNGTALTLTAVSHRQPSPNHATLLWPSQPLPENHSWALWTRALNGFIRADSPARQLTTALGRWFEVPSGWQCFHDPITNTLLQYDSGTLYSYRSYVTGHATRQQRFHRHLPVASLPPSALPTTAYGTATIVRHTGTVPCAARPATTTHDWWGRILVGPTNLHALLAGIAAGTAICVTDGSYKEPFGTAAYTLKSSLEAADEFTLVNPTPGHPDDVDPYLAELAGLYGCLATVRRLCQDYAIGVGGITVGCDCQSVLYNVFDLPDGKIKPSRAHYTLLAATRRLLSSSTISWKGRHIYGHQDRTIAYAQLDHWAQLNVDMDGLAKQYWQHLQNSHFAWFSLPPLPGEWTLWHLEYRFPSWNPALAHRHLYNRSTSTYWQNKLRLANNPNIDWEASGMAFRTLSLYQQLWTPKWLTSFVPYGKNIARWGGINMCPRCGGPEDHRHHVLSCPAPDAITCWNNNVTALDSWLVIQTTHPTLRTAIITLLKSWHTGRRLRHPATPDASLRRLFREQDASLFVDGHLHTLWAAAQQDYYLRLGRRTTGKRWVARLIRKIWEIAWAMWRDRYRALTSPDSATLAAEHQSLDVAILDAYARYEHTQTPSLTRWFSNPQDDVLSRNLDFKHHWLEMVALLSRP